ncbi:hypothetical protein DENIS_1352 [Desulfonema ishimotonii]|uniref:EF-hand domain-containing protein n=1 Tax=Desulfonema ishimotonii TaxID=45657 RepID=A0A401FTX0_9BACT|nr:PilW family protein [Desulfonema ishimotonii]GBC60400.1 hypothetical protein DENIS_1352 [Desulfonema ishimotonii]
MKRIILCFISVIIGFSGSIVPGYALQNAVRGDLNGDRDVNLSDAIIALRISVDMETEVTGILAETDMDGDGQIGLEEAICALQVAAELRRKVFVAEDIIRGEIQMAGGGLEGYPIVDGFSDEDRSPLTFKNNLGLGGSDEIIIRYVVPVSDPCGDDPDESDGIDTPCGSLPDLTIDSALSPSSAEIDVREDLAAAPYSEWDDGCYCDGKTYGPPRYGIPFMITPPDSAPGDSQVLHVTGIQSWTGMFQIRPFTDDDGFSYPNKALSTYPSGSRICFFDLGPVRVVRFFITENNALMREDSSAGTTSQPIAENIRNMQIVLGLDRNGDGVAEEWIEDGELTEEDKAFVTDARISLTETD